MLVLLAGQSLVQNDHLHDILKGSKVRQYFKSTHVLIIAFWQAVQAAISE